MHFVYRSHYEGLMSKWVRRLPDPTVLAWFRRGWACDDPEQWVEDDLGVEVYGLDDFFVGVQKSRLPPPQTTDELRALLHEHLYVEYDPDDCIRLDEHTLRVRTDDDEVELAYFFLDDDTASKAPDRLAYLLHEWPLPAHADRPGPFTPDVPVTALSPAGGDETTYAVFLTFYDGESMARCPPLAFPGVDLPNLARHLRTTPTRDTWQPELLVLKALIGPAEDDLAPALERCNRWPGFNLNADPWPDLPDDHDVAHRRALEVLEQAEYLDDRRPETSRLLVSDHLAQLAMHCGDSFGHQQWFLFDTRWAATHPDLARSLLRYAEHWDPLDR
ncbi:hypothetical protein [Saccharothrix syringae]|uniref:Uncharacterized protein n=1 Tax=Saccharothrix syringae TaxID=103733 RepID=A0A5Q0GZP4_SACSY|nr:hypothetical protein [Saccharothrix syringae]QFZ19476.1 hypothetical protein EKG83_20360 [Saccharothrix syringae]